MNSQPRYIETHPYSPGRDRSSPSSHSPRKPHVDGDVPPELSPLDAFALQGRLLAKQLDQTSKDGRRMSRLPPLTIANSLALPRPGYLRSQSAGNDSFGPRAGPPQVDQASPHLRAAVEAPDKRPVSIYPRFSGIVESDGADEAPGVPTIYNRRRVSSDALRDLERQQPPTSRSNPYTEESRSNPYIDESRSDYERGDLNMRPKRSFDSQRQPSAQPGHSGYDHRDLDMRPKRSFDSQRQPIPQRGPSTESNRSRLYHHSNALAPPRSPVPRQVSSIRSVPPESSDEEGTNSQVDSFTSISRKQSASSALSGHSSPPFSPVPLPRSPSISSEYSIGGGRAPRPPAYNFSRPISRASRPSEEMSSRQEFYESQGSHFGDENMHTPVSMNSDDVENSDLNAPAASYIYSRFALPRGRRMDRNSLLHLEDHLQDQQPSNKHQQYRGNSSMPDGETTPNASFPQRPLSPPSPQKRRIMSPPQTHPESPPRPSMQSADRPPSARSEAQSHKASAPSVSSGATIKPQNRSAPTSTEITAEQHLAKGIECHERGSLKESTYHLRIAARQNNPTAMLLYALACRHGWGMRPNQREGVQWLRKAADSASLELADDEDLVKEGVSGDYMERKTRRAQFALSIYELGVSHMNGWGIEQDKVLALRCFEIAACRCSSTGTRAMTDVTFSVGRW